MTKKHMVTKDNDLIGASYSLGVAEQRLIFLAIMEAREQDKLIDAMGLLRINASSYQKHFKVSRQTSYEALKAAVLGLFYAELEYSQIDEKTGKKGVHKKRWVQHIVYIDDAACVELQFTNPIIPLITRLDERYTEYELKQVSELQSEYAIRLYELLIQWRKVGKTNEIPVSDLRSKLGVGLSQYKVMSDFKKRVLNHAVKQINDFTDISASYSQEKVGKSITGFIFRFQPKKTIEHAATAHNKARDIDTPDIFHNMTDSQIATFSSKLADLPELGGNAPIGKSTAEFAAIIASDLADESKQGKYMPYLEKMGYKTAKNKA